MNGLGGTGAQQSKALFQCISCESKPFETLVIRSHQWHNMTY